MGCDIHTYREKFVAGRWVSADVWSTKQCSYQDVDEQAYDSRNYDLFGLISNSSGRRNFEFGMPARGIPFDASEQYRSLAVLVPDWHSHSYLYLHELKSLLSWFDGEGVCVHKFDQLMKSFVTADLESIIESFNGIDGENHRLCFFFDN